MSTHTSTETRSQTIISLREQGWSFSLIAKEAGIPKRTAQNIWEKLKKHGTTKDRRVNNGRVTKLTDRMATKIKAVIKTTPDATAVEIRRSIKEPISPRTLRRYRRALGFKPVKGKPKTPLTCKHMATRKEWCRQYKNDDLDNVIWTDEKPFVLGKRRRSLWQGPGEPRPEYIKWKTPVKVMIWGGVSKRGKTTLHFVSGTINALRYVDILQRHLVGPGSRMFPHGFVLQQDRATPHTAKLTSKWLDQKNIPHFLTPPNSPDLNPIELIWNIMEARVAKRSPATKEELVAAIKREWQRISQEEINGCILHSQKLRAPVVHRNGNRAKNAPLPKKRD